MEARVIDPTDVEVLSLHHGISTTIGEETVLSPWQHRLPTAK
jgi:hypothetical protein